MHESWHENFLLISGFLEGGDYIFLNHNNAVDIYLGIQLWRPNIFLYLNAFFYLRKPGDKT